MGLPWVRVDATLASNKKILDLAERKRWRAISMYVFGLTYSGHQLTDGFVPKGALPFIHGTPKDADALVCAGLWIVRDGGWEINDWDEYQPSASHLAGRSAAGRMASCARWMKTGKECTCGMHR